MEGQSMAMYQQIVDDIVSRTGGDINNMTYSEKIIIILAMKEVKRRVDKYFRDSYPIVKAWASLDVEDIILGEKEPDLSRFQADKADFYSEFAKLWEGTK